MSRQDANAAFALTSFLYGANAAYIEDLYARYEADPASVDAQWQSFFQSLKDDPASVTKSAKGASWKTPGWPQVSNGELVAALDGNWAETEKVISDKIKGRAQKAGVQNVRGAVGEGQPAAQILEIAAREGCDAIVLGSRGLGDARSLLLGSVSHKVAHLADATCIIVK